MLLKKSNNLHKNTVQDRNVECCGGWSEGNFRFQKQCSPISKTKMVRLIVNEKKFDFFFQRCQQFHEHVRGDKDFGKEIYLGIDLKWYFQKWPKSNAAGKDDMGYCSAWAIPIQICLKVVLIFTYPEGDLAPDEVALEAARVLHSGT